jgi:hypothetical protein
MCEVCTDCGIILFEVCALYPGCTDKPVEKCDNCIILDNERSKHNLNGT